MTKEIVKQAGFYRYVEQREGHRDSGAVKDQKYEPVERAGKFCTEYLGGSLEKVASIALRYFFYVLHHLIIKTKSIHGRLR